MIAGAMSYYTDDTHSSFRRPSYATEVQIILYKLYDDQGMPYYREPVYLKRFTAEEWNT